MSLQELAIVTGGNRGIGRVLTEELAKAMPVLCIARSNPPAQWTHETSSRHRIHALQVDLSQLSILQYQLGDWLRRYCDYRVSTLLLNAAILSLGRLDDMHPDDLNFAFRTNVFSSIAIVSTLLKMQRFNCKGSQVTYVTSSLARMDPALTFSGIGLYSTTKAAASRVAMVQAREFALTKPYIRVARVHPGIVDTNMQSSLRSETGLDPRFAEKTAGLPPYQKGDWDLVAPTDAMRTISPEMAADFILWVSDRGDDQAKEFDYYATAEYHTIRDERLSRLGANCKGPKIRDRTRSA